MNAKELRHLLEGHPGDLDVEVLVGGEVYGIEGIEVDVREQEVASRGADDPEPPTYTVLQIVADG